jgi:S1-C subfamily serine protease
MPFSNNCVVTQVGKAGAGQMIRSNFGGYLDLSRLSINNGRLTAWARWVSESALTTPNKIDFYTRDAKLQIDCSAGSFSLLEEYFFDKENKQVDFWKAPTNLPLNINSVRPGTGMDNMLQLACKNTPKPPLTPDVPARPNIAMSPPNNSTSRVPIVVSSGTAFGLSKNQFITNAHVVEGCSAVKVGGLASIVQAIDARSDLALLNVPNYGDIAKLRAGRLRQGDAVTVVGYPLNGILATGAQVTAGNVSALAGMGNDSRFIQISAPVQPGNSGGPLVDSSGNVVGVVVSKLNALKMASITGDIPQNVNFAISPLVLQAFLEANSVDYLTTPSTKNLSTADVADVAKKYTSLVECYK